MSASSSTMSTRLAMPGAMLPAPRLADLEDKGAVRAEAAPRRLGEHPARRLADRLVGQIEGAPVHAEEAPTPQVLEGRHRLLRRQVDEGHDRRRRVGPDREGGDVEGAEPLTDLAKAGEVAGVAAEVEPPVA